MSPPGELTTIRHLRRDTGILYFATYAVEMNKCDAPESNNMIVVLELEHTVNNA
jgi:hypothetical protein